MAEASGRLNRSALMWLRLREQGYYFLLVLPVLLLLLAFFLAPLCSMLIRSFQAGPQGILAENQAGAPLTESARQIQLPHRDITDLDGDGKVTVTDVNVRVVRKVEVREIDAEAGSVALAEPPPERALLFVAYNEVEREIVLRRSGDGRNLKVRSSPIRDRDGDGQVAPDDIDAWLEITMPAETLGPDKGVVSLPRPLAPGETALFRYRYDEPVTLSHYEKVLTTDYYWNWNIFEPSLFRTTFEIALFTTFGCFLLGYPVAYLLASVSARWRTILVAFVIIPFWTSILVRTFAWQVILGNAGLVNYVLQSMGATSEPLPMVFNRFGVYVGMVHVLLPFMILPVFAVMRGIPEHPLRAASSLGASPLWVFLRVYLPLSAPGIWAGSLIVFILSLGFFVTPALLGGPADRMVSNIISVQFDASTDWGFGSALAFLLLAPTAALYVAYIRIVRSQNLYSVTARRPALAGRGDDGGKRGDGPAVPRLRQAGWPTDGGILSRSLASRRVIYLLLGCAALAVISLSLLVYETPPFLLALLLLCTVATVVTGAVVSRLSGVALPKLLFGLFVGSVLVYLMLPNFIVMPISFTHHPVFLSFPGSGFTLENFAAYFGIGEAGHFQRRGWIPATMTSLQVAAMVVAVSVPLGFLAAYGLVRGEFRGRDLIGYLVILPLIVPTLVIAIAAFMFFSRFMPFLIGSAADIGPLKLPLGFVVAHSLLAIPYVVVIISAALKGVNPTYEQAAMSLGAGRMKALRLAVLPQIMPAVVSSAFFAFLISFDELIIAIFLSTPQVRTLPKRLWDGVQQEVDPTIAAVSTILVVVTLVVLSAAALIQRRLSGLSREE